MNIKKLFKRKPAWQSSNPQKRIDAVVALEDQAILRHVAERDTDMDVRVKAIRKIQSQQDLYDFIVEMGKSNAFADRHVRTLAISCMKDKALLSKLLSEDTNLNRHDLQDINYILRDSEKMKHYLEGATLMEYIGALKEGVLTGKDLEDVEKSALVEFVDRTVTSMDAVHLAEVLSARSLLRVLKETNPQLRILKTPAWIALFNKTINNPDDSSIDQTEEFRFMHEEWTKIKDQTNCLHFSDEQYKTIQDNVKMLGMHPHDFIQRHHLHQMVENTPKVNMTGYSLGDKEVTLTILGAKKLPELPREKDNVYQLTGLKTEKFFAFKFENIRFYTGLPLVCAKCGKPMTKFVVMAGHSCIHRSFAKVRIAADNAQEIFYQMNHLKELIAVPSCDTCDVSQSILFKDRDLNPGNAANLSDEPNFYTDDEQMVYNLHRNGFLVEKFRIENNKAIPLPLNFTAPRCLLCEKELDWDVDLEAPLIREGKSLDICMDCRNLHGDKNISCENGHIIKLTIDEYDRYHHDCLLCRKGMYYDTDGDRMGDRNFHIFPCKGKEA